VHHEQEYHGPHIVCCSVRALFRLLLRISVFENLALDKNTRLSHISKRSTIFRLCVQPTIGSLVEPMESEWTNRLGTEIADTWPVPAKEAKEEEEDEEDDRDGDDDDEGEQEGGRGVASAASIPFELIHGTVAIQDNDQEMPDAGRALITNATNAGSGYNVASAADNLQEDSPPVPNDPNYLASEVMPEHSVASPVIAPSSFVVAPSSFVVAPSTPVIPPPGSFIAPSGQNELVSRPIIPTTVGQIVTSQLVREPALLAAAIRGPIDESLSSDEPLTDNLGNIPAQIVPVPGGMGSVPALVIRAPNVPPRDFAEDDRPQVPRWPISLHVHDLLRLEIIELLPWNQLSNR
jgi:hypothetical protein